MNPLILYIFRKDTISLLIIHSPLRLSVQIYLYFTDVFCYYYSFTYICRVKQIKICTASYTKNQAVN